MGNASSKDSLPAFSRSDTQSSAMSSKSVRSALSIRSRSKSHPSSPIASSFNNADINSNSNTNSNSNNINSSLPSAKSTNNSSNNSSQTHLAKSLSTSNQSSSSLSHISSNNNSNLLNPNIENNTNNNSTRRHSKSPSLPANVSSMNTIDSLSKGVNGISLNSSSNRDNNDSSEIINPKDDLNKTSQNSQSDKIKQNDQSNYSSRSFPSSETNLASSSPSIIINNPVPNSVSDQDQNQKSKEYEQGNEQDRSQNQQQYDTGSNNSSIPPIPENSSNINLNIRSHSSSSLSLPKPRLSRRRSSSNSIPTQSNSSHSHHHHHIPFHGKSLRSSSPAPPKYSSSRSRSQSRSRSSSRISSPALSPQVSSFNSQDPSPQDPSPSSFSDKLMSHFRQSPSGSTDLNNNDNNTMHDSTSNNNDNRKFNDGLNPDTQPLNDNNATRSNNTNNIVSNTILVENNNNNSNPLLHTPIPSASSPTSLSPIDNTISTSTGSSKFSSSFHRGKSRTSTSESAGSSSSNSGLVDIDEVITKLLNSGISGKVSKSICLKSSEIAQITAMAREIFLAQPALIELSPPVKVVGDVHGQYSDLLRLFKLCGFPPSANYLFLGDYVDRGKQSLETILLLLCYKIKYPENFFLLRGNHECANVTRVYGFYDECKRRSSLKVWHMFIDTFNTLPIAAVVASKIFCVHGGLSPSLHSMSEIRNLERPTDIPDSGLLNDLLWSDPAYTTAEWEDNERGVSYCYGKTAINKFLAKFSFDLVCRAHMVVEDGYEFFNERSLVTVFSAPNYCGEFDNWGAVMSVSEELLCSFQLLKPLDSVAIKQELKRWRQNGVLASPPASNSIPQSY